MGTLRLREEPNNGQCEPHPCQLRRSKALSKEYSSKKRQRDDLAHTGHHGTLPKPMCQQAYIGEVAQPNREGGQQQEVADTGIGKLFE